MTGTRIAAITEIAGAGMGITIAAGLIGCLFCVRFVRLLAESWELRTLEAY